jgi:hypothetical protein
VEDRPIGPFLWPPTTLTLSKLVRNRGPSARSIVAATIALACLAVGGGQALAATDFLVGVAEDSPKWTPPAGYPASEAAEARGLGIEAFRITVPWAAGQTELSATTITEVNRTVSLLGPEFRLVVAVYGAPKSAPQDDVARGQYCAYVRDLVVRYPRVNDVAIWNEPNLWFWQPQFNADGTSASPAAYGALLARCYDVLHEVRPQINVIAPVLSPSGNNNPNGSSPSHSPDRFIRELGTVYRASGRQLPLFDTVGHHIYGASTAERPWLTHFGGRISEGDYGKLIQNLTTAFSGTAQPLPGQCSGKRCVYIWYLEGGWQTQIDENKAALYTNTELTPNVIPDFAGGEPESPPPAATSPAPDQATQVLDGVRLAYCQPYVKAFFNFHLWDEPGLGGWQSGPFWYDRTRKDSYGAFHQAFAEANTGTIDCSRLKGGPPPRPDTAPPDAPPTLSATASIGSSPMVTLDWDDGPESDLAGYTVYRATATGGPYVLAGTTTRGLSTYTDTGVTNGTTYYYAVAAFDTADNESSRSPEASAAPRAPIVKVYRPAGYTLVAGSVYSGRGAISRLYENDGSRLEVSATRTGGLYVAELSAVARVDEAPALLRKLTVSYDGGASSGSATLSVSVYRWTTAGWTVVYGPRTPGTSSDVGSTWTTPAAAEYVGPSGEIRVKIRGTRSSSFRTQTDLVRASVEY